MSKSYILSVLLALLVHTCAHGIHVGSVCIVSWVSWLLLLFDVIWVVSMHDPQDPEDAAVTSDPFGYNKVNGGWTKFQSNKREMVFNGFHGCQFVNGNTIHAHVVRLCFWSFSGLVVCCKFPRGCRCYVLYCQSLYILQLLVTQKWHEVTSLMLLLGRNQLKLPYLGSQQIHLVLLRHKWGENRIRKMKIRVLTAQHDQWVKNTYWKKIPAIRTVVAFSC